MSKALLTQITDVSHVGDPGTRTTLEGRGCRTPGSADTSTLSFSSPKIRDLSAARLERKQGLAHPTTSLSSDTLLTAVKVQKIALDWSTMKQQFKDASSVNASMISVNESEVSTSSSAVHLVHVLKAASTTVPKLLSSRSVSVAGSKRMLFNRKVSNPPRCQTPAQGCNLLSKLLKCSGNLTSRVAGPREVKPTRKPRQVIEVSLFPSRDQPQASGKKEKPKPRLIEVSMTKG